MNGLAVIGFVVASMATGPTFDGQLEYLIHYPEPENTHGNHAHALNQSQQEICDKKGFVPSSSGHMVYCI